MIVQCSKYCKEASIIKRGTAHGILAIFWMFISAGCVNPITRNYTTAYHKADYIQESGPPQIIEKSNETISYLSKMQEDGYAILGWSKIKNPGLNFHINKESNNIIRKAKELNASKVVVFHDYAFKTGGGSLDGGYSSAPTRYSATAYTSFGNTTYIDIVPSSSGGGSLYEYNNYKIVFFAKQKTGRIRDKTAFRDYFLDHQTSNIYHWKKYWKKVTIPVPNNLISLKSFLQTQRPKEKRLSELLDDWVFVHFKSPIPSKYLDTYLEETKDLHEISNADEVLGFTFAYKNQVVDEARTIAHKTPPPKRAIQIRSHSRDYYEFYNNKKPYSKEEFDEQRLTHYEAYPNNFNNYNSMAYRFSYKPSYDSRLKRFRTKKDYEMVTCAWVYSPNTYSMISISIGTPDTREDLEWANKTIDPLVDFILKKSDTLNADINNLLN